MRTKKEIQELGKNIVESARHVSWKDVEKLKRITTNIHLLRLSIKLLEDYPSEIKLLARKNNIKDSLEKVDKDQIKSINYILKISAQ